MKPLIVMNRENDILQLGCSTIKLPSFYQPPKEKEKENKNKTPLHAKKNLYLLKALFVKMKNHYNIYVQRGEEDDPCSGKGIDESESEKEQLLFKIRIE